MSTAVKWIIGIIVAAAVVAGGGYFYLRNQASQQNASALSSYTFTRLTSGNIDTVVSATGTVRTNQTATLSWTASGTVGKVNVKVGDTVKANDILASLDPNNLPNNIIQAQQALITDQQALSDLQNNKVNLPTLQQAVTTAETAVTNAQTARNNLNFPRGTDNQIAAAQAAVTLAQQKVNDAKSNYDHTPGDPTTDARKAQALASYQAALTGLTSTQNNLAYIQGTPSSTDIATADNNLALAKAQLADAQRALSQTQNGVDPTQLAADQAKIAADQAIIDSQNLRASFSGTVTNATVMTGDIVSSGTTAFRIDDTSAYLIDLGVSEIDIAKVALNQPVQVAFDAIPTKTYNAVVSYVSQVGTTSSGVVNFTVTIKLTDADNLVKPGITASGNIIVNSIQNVLVVPNRAIKTINGRKVVYVVTFTNAAGTPVAAGGFGGQTTRSTTRTAGQGAQNGQQTTPVPGGQGSPTGRQTTRTPGSGGQNFTGGQTGNGSGQTGTGGTGGFGGFNTTGLTEQVSEVQVQVGASNDTDTEIKPGSLQQGALIITNPPSTGVPTTANNARGGAFGGLFGGIGVRVRAPGG